MSRQDREAQQFINDVIAKKEKAVRHQWIYEHIDDPDHADFLTTLLYYRMGIQDNITNEKEIHAAIQG